MRVSANTTTLEDRRHVERIIAEESAKAKVDAQYVINMSRLPAAMVARFAAVKRLSRESQWSVRRIALAWGTDGPSIRRILNRPDDHQFGVYDPLTIERLRTQYGALRTEMIITGRDPRTINDLAAWRRATARAQ